MWGRSVVKEDRERERRIQMEIVVDCYGEIEHAIGWHCYLDDQLKFPFRARCVALRVISPLTKGEEIEVLKMAPEGECEKEMFVIVRWKGRRLGVPLGQLESIDVDHGTDQAIRDWHYWMKRGYEF